MPNAFVSATKESAVSILDVDALDNALSLPDTACQNCLVDLHEQAFSDDHSYVFLPGAAVDKLINKWSSIG